MALVTPFAAATRFGTSVFSTDHAQWVQMGYDSGGGAWTPLPIDANGLDADVTRVGGLTTMRTLGALYAARGQRFIATTGYQSHNLNAAENMALITNPSGSNRWIFLDLLEFGAVSANSRFSRFGGSFTFTTGTPLTIGNTGGFTMTAGTIQEAKLQLYGKSQFTITAAGTLRKVAPMADSQPYFAEVFGASILQPGQSVYWTTNEPVGGGTGTYEAYINFEWYEVTATQGAAINTAANAITPA